MLSACLDCASWNSKEFAFAQVYFLVWGPFLIQWVFKLHFPALLLVVPKGRHCKFVSRRQPSIPPSIPQGAPFEISFKYKMLQVFYGGTWPKMSHLCTETFSKLHKTLTTVLHCISTYVLVIKKYSFCHDLPSAATSDKCNARFEHWNTGMLCSGMYWTRRSCISQAAPLVGGSWWKMWTIRGLVKLNKKRKRGLFIV